MKSNYKAIGEYIKPVNVRNDELKVNDLMGINIDKFFMPSVANTIGTDMSKYKVVKKGQFACNRMHVGRDKRLPVALWNGENNIIVSPAYDVFEISDTGLLDSNYLMMWFLREEFDRNAWFFTDADVRGGLKWEDFCNMKLPVPSITKQKEIVNEYNVLLERLKLNNSFIEKLEETTQTLFKQWFVDFDFPDENGNPYKSSGKEMEFNNELDIDIPKGWRIGKLEDIATFKNGKVKPNSIGKTPVYGGNGIVEYVNDFNEENVIAIGRVGAYCGSLYRIPGKCWISDNAISAESKSQFNMFIYYLLSSLNLNERSEGTGQPLITQGLLNGIKIVIPEDKVISIFESYATKIFQLSELKSKEIDNLNKLLNLLLSKLQKIGG
ncbi:MAG TPA: restriction endonuclease subunit S [Ureibacillus sp.]|nr:restriction endonuclease subunit S [Ureibacillus sp.]